MSKALSAVHAGLLDCGYTLTHERDFGLSGRDVARYLAPALVADPRGEGKRHARDVIVYNRTAGCVAEAESVAFRTAKGEVVDDFARFRLLSGPHPVRLAVARVLALIPSPGRQQSGSMSADYFRYGPGVEIAPHQDGHGDYVIIWCLRRRGHGAESFLLRDGETVLRRALEPGEILVFRDELFEHGMTELTGDGAYRDALIFITLRGT